MERLSADVAALAAMTRDSAGPGERLSARWIAERLGEVGAGGVAIEPYRGRTTYGWAQAALLAAGLVAARLPRAAGWPLALGALAALEADASGRVGIPLATGEGANVVGHIPAAGPRRGTLVLVAHHDAARTGLIWHPRLRGPGADRRRRTRAIDPYLAPAAAALLAHRTWLGRAVLWLGIASELDVATSRTVPGASDNATGVAAVLALAERWAADPLDGVEVVCALVGSEESGMAGMRAFLRARALDPASTLVLGLDTLGAGEPIVLEGEWAVLRARYRPQDLALVPAEVPRWTIGGWTDPVLALHAGLAAISLLSIGPEGAFTDYHLPSDTADRVDRRSVERCVEIAAGVGEAFARRVG